jgi:hypothetical protein
VPLPTPHPGRVISYAYLWAGEHAAGREEGVKHRPCAIVLARTIVAGRELVTVVPVTHAPPAQPADALEIPPAVKRLLGLDDQPSWIILTEVNDFIWPGPDLAPVPGSGGQRFDYGVLPPGFFRTLRDKTMALIAERRVKQVPRTE